jgi:CrcB protein
LSGERVTLVLIFLAGGAGSVLRYGLGRLIQGQSHSGFPFGTLAVNFLGCLAIGMLTRFFTHAQSDNALRAMLVVGFCGGFTTFSTFSLETMALFEGGELQLAALYVGASLLLCLAGTAAGLRVGPVLSP